MFLKKDMLNKRALIFLSLRQGGLEIDRYKKYINISCEIYIYIYILMYSIIVHVIGTANRFGSSDMLGK